MTVVLATPDVRSAEAPAAGCDLIRVESLGKDFPKRRRLREALLHPHRHESVHALQDVSFAIREGELFGLLGPNGAGKSTLFKLLATLVLPDHGTATIAGHDLVRQPGQIRRVVGFVNAEERSLNWRLSAGENLRLFAALYGMRGELARQRIADVLTDMELEHTGTRMVGLFSTGMRQRLLIARALLSRPKVLLLDEPTRSLDPLAARRFRVLLRDELVRRQGCTVILATHNAEEAMTLCDRVAVLHQGRLLAVGVAAALARRVAGSRFRVRTPTPRHVAFRRLSASGVISQVRNDSLETERETGTVEFEIEAGAQHAAAVLSELIRNGLEVLDFRRVELSLVDLLERLVGSSPQSEAPHA